jgi:hypothetical protein
MFRAHSAQAPLSSIPIDSGACPFQTCSNYTDSEVCCIQACSMRHREVSSRCNLPLNTLLLISKTVTGELPHRQRAKRPITCCLVMFSLKTKVEVNNLFTNTRGVLVYKPMYKSNVLYHNLNFDMSGCKLSLKQQFILCDVISALADAA